MRWIPSWAYLFCQRFEETRSSHFANVFSWGLGSIHQQASGVRSETEHYGVIMHCLHKSDALQCLHIVA